jgi:hypothetical protein
MFSFSFHYSTFKSKDRENMEEKKVEMWNDMEETQVE